MATVLVIEDDPQMRELMEAILQGHGYTVRTAGDGVAALVAMRPAPDVILLDLQMNGLDGRGFLKKLRAMNLWGPPVIVVSGADLVLADLEELGVTALVRKPVEMKTLLDVVGAATA
jgi:CheY-like chemotaxis protein